MTLVAAGCGGSQQEAARQAGRLLEQGKAEEALAAYRQGKQEQPGEAVFPFGEGLSLYKLERLDEALTALEEANRLQPRADHYLYLGHVLFRMQRLPEAVQAYQQATRLDPGDAQGWKGLGFAEYYRKRYPQARTALQKYLALAPAAEDRFSVTQMISSLPQTE